MAEVCSECQRPWPCGECPDIKRDLHEIAHLTTDLQQIRLLRKASALTHEARRSFMSDGLAAEADRAAGLCESIDDLAGWMKEKIH